MITELKYGKLEFQDINVALVKHALFTGSQRFFKTGNDLDYVITWEDLKNKLPELFREYRRNQNKGCYPSICALGFRNYPDSFDLIKINVDGGKIDLIIVHNDLEFNLWKFATNCVVRLCASPAKRMIQKKKKYRVELFEFFKKMYRDEHSEEYDKMGVRFKL